jgi:hypothetical protein
MRIHKYVVWFYNFRVVPVRTVKLENAQKLIREHFQKRINIGSKFIFISFRTRTYNRAVYTELYFEECSFTDD